MPPTNKANLNIQPMPSLGLDIYSGHQAKIPNITQPHGGITMCLPSGKVNQKEASKEAQSHPLVSCICIGIPAGRDLKHQQHEE